MIIRWLGAFGKASSLHASLKFELGRSLTDEVAAEDIRTCSLIKHAKVGLLISNKSIIKINPKYYRPSEVELLLGDPSKAKEIIGWEPTTKFNELVEKMMLHDLKINKK